MNYPKLNEIPTTRDLLDKFKGYNHNLRIGEGEFYDMQNLTGDDYPVLSPRKKRGIYGTALKPNGMCSNTRFCYVDGQDYHMVGKDDLGNIVDEMVDLKLVALDKDKPTRDLISIGSNVVIMPDQKYINTVDIAQRGHLRAGIYDLPEQNPNSDVHPKLKIVAVGTISNETKFEIFSKPLIIVRRGQEVPKASGEYVDTIAFVWEDRPTDAYGKSQPPQYEIRYCTKTSNFGEPAAYGWREGTPLEFGDGWHWFKIGIYFEDDDTGYRDFVISEMNKYINSTVTIKGLCDGFSNESKTLYTTKFTVGGLEKTGLVVHAVSKLRGQENPADKNSFVEWLFAEGDVVETRTETTPISIETPESENSTIPKLDYIMESGNRLWGCRYGPANNGEFVNEIYASRLGDFKDWVMPEVTTSQSPYRVTVGTSGAFTGAINYGGKPIFFKEDCMHRVFGDYTPYSVQMIPCKGVQEGCSKSLAIVNDVLYYKSRSGICAYDGSLPVEISYDFGDKQYKNAVGGAIGNKYYVSMQDEEGNWSMFTYDTVKKMWHREDDTQAKQFCNHQGNLYYIDHADNRIHVVKGTGDDVAPEESVKWSAETGILGATTPDNKYVSRIDLRMSVAKGSSVAVHIQYDSMGDWERLMEIEGLTLTTFTIPVIPRRCDHFRLKFEGEGDAKIFSISKTLEETE